MELNESINESGWSEEDESNFKKLDSDLWTYFCWHLKDPSGINGVPDISVSISGLIYNTLSKYYPKHDTRENLRNVINELYIKDVTIHIREREETKYTEYREAETINLERGKIIGGKKCEIFGVTKDGEEIHLKYEWVS